MTSIPATPADYLILADLEKPYNFPAVFSNDHPVELEIGAGRGDFAVEYCRKNPDRNFVAVERKLNYLKRGVNKSKLLELENLRFLNVEIQHFLEEYVSPRQLDAVHIYFPDPWPKKRQKKRRIVQDRLISVLAEKIVPGGYLHLRTDHHEYFEHMMEVMGSQAWFKQVPVPEALRAFLTGFERRFVADGLPINYASYQLQHPDDSADLQKEA